MADFAGDISLVLSVVSLFLLVVGLPFIRGTSSKKNLIRHGYLTIVALVLQTVMVFWAMLPAFFEEFEEVLALSPLFALNTWVHVGLGVLAEAAGFFFVGLWLSVAVSNLRCARAKKYMTPVFVVWLIAVVTGALVHLLEML